MARPEFGEAIRERRYDVGYAAAGDCAKASLQLEQEHPHLFKSFSQQTLSRLERDQTGAAVEGAHFKMVCTLAYLLNWTSLEFEQHVGVAIPRVPLLERPGGNRTPQPPPEQKVVRVPHYGSLTTGVHYQQRGATPSKYARYLVTELPPTIDKSARLFLAQATNHVAYEEGLRLLVPLGATLLIEAGATPSEGDLTVAHLHNLDVVTVARHRRRDKNVFMRAPATGGVAFWSDSQPAPRVIGVIRQVHYQPELLTR